METKERIPPLTGREGSEINLNVATEWTKYHRERTPGGVISQFFGQDILKRILNQPNCIGIRIYYANSKPLSAWQRFVLSVARFFAGNTEGEVHLIISGVTEYGIDQLPSGTGEVAEAFSLKTTAAASSSGSTILGEQSVPCPGGIGCPQNALTGA